LLTIPEFYRKTLQKLMMQEILALIPSEFISFIMVALFSLVIGLSQRKVHPVSDDSRLFGTDRTFTFIGILGYILYIAAPSSLWLYGCGGLMIGVFLGINYFFKIQRFGDFGLTTIIIALITYSLAPLVMTQPAWLYLLVIVVVLVFTEMKETFSTLSDRFEKEEFITLAKFLIIAGIILPIVPDKPIVDFLSLTPYRVWLAVVVISSISYLSYLLKKFVFHTSGVVLSGILGGLYSSTATTFILARKSKDHPELSHQYSAGIIFATSMMYLRILILIGIFNTGLFLRIWWIFIGLFIVSMISGALVLLLRKNKQPSAEITGQKDKNPLEFRVAIIFTILYVGFTFVTYFTINNFGKLGLNLLSFVVGVTDIDPFLLNLFQGKFDVGIEVIAAATLQAIISNNVLKMIYGIVISGKPLRRTLLIGFSVIIFVNIVLLLFV
jgi:uncharacterized membrane protein (DUF4010 family)